MSIVLQFLGIQCRYWKNGCWLLCAASKNHLSWPQPSANE